MDMTLWSWTTSQNTVDLFPNHGPSSVTPTHSLSDSDQVLVIGLDSWQFGHHQVNLQHILSLVVIVVSSLLCSTEEYLILAPVLMEAIHGVY